MTRLTIGHIAKRAGVNIQTIRYYQRRGLITEPAKPDSGYRTYTPECIDRIRFIKRAQGLGFTLFEIADLIALGDGHCDDVQQLAKLKRDKIQQQIKDLKRMQRILNRYLDECSNNRDPGHCSMIEALSTGACCEIP